MALGKSDPLSAPYYCKGVIKDLIVYWCNKREAVIGAATLAGDFSLFTTQREDWVEISELQVTHLNQKDLHQI